MKRERYRTVFDLQRDKVLPSGPHGEGDDPRFMLLGARAEAIKQVLSALPDAQYDQWKRHVNDVIWFAPHYGLWGRTWDYPTRKVIIYLSPILDHVGSDEAVVGVVVHEIAHFLLRNYGPETPYEQRESEVERAIREWGFAAEVEAMENVLRNFFRPPTSTPPL